MIIDEKNLAKLKDLNNPKVLNIVEDIVALCKPSKVTVLTDSEEDLEYIRRLTKQTGEENELSLSGHNIHFDSYRDQARDKANTKILLRPEQKISKKINSGDRESCLSEVYFLMDGIMKGKEMLVCFFCLGPNNSKFSIPALQITDSTYVAHSETILYRPGYEEFKRLNDNNNNNNNNGQTNTNGNDKNNFFHFVHSAGELDQNNNSKNIKDRRVYVDLEEDRVFTVNNQYAGNSVGLKKLALRLAINKSHHEEWLCEHMFVMGVKPENKNRLTYFTGAFPSACGKTSTAMIPGQTIIGDDIAYLKVGEEGLMYAANVEQGIFGIIENVNPVDDPLIYQALTTPREIIFSNILINNNQAYWLGMGKELPSSGKNHFGDWNLGMKDQDSKEVLPTHKNARYTIRIKELDNVDSKIDDPNGVPISGIIYGGRDSDTSPPVLESFSWGHGVFIGAAIESETTAAALGQEGVRKHNPMANLDFLVIPLGTYIENHLKFAEKLVKVPRIFATNYFLKEDGNFLNEKVDKKVWLLWMEGRVNNEYEAIETPIGLIPKYEDLKELFKEVFDREYRKEDYDKQFAIRTEKLLDRLNRIEQIYNEEDFVPEMFFKHIKQQRERLVSFKNTNR